MLKKLLLATTVCIALSACNDSSSSSSTEPSEPLATLSFENLSDVSSIARVETSSEDGSHLIGFDANGAPIGDISNIGVEDFTPTSDGGFVVEVTENHKANYLYQNIGDKGEEHEPIAHTYRRPVWYFVNSTGDYYLITDKKELPEFIGENSIGLLIFSDGETFNTQTKHTGHLFNDISLDANSIIAAVTAIQNRDPSTPNDPEIIQQIIGNLVEGNHIEKMNNISLMKADELLSTSDTLGDILTNTTTALPDLSGACKAIIVGEDNVELCKNVTAYLASLTFKAKIKNLADVTQALPIPDSEMALLNTGLLQEDGTIYDYFSGGWDGESAQDSKQAYVLSSTFSGQSNCQDMNKQCLYSVVKLEESSGGLRPTITTTIASDFVINNNTGFETESEAGQIEGGQQNYLWVNDSYIVIKEATQISIIDRADNNKLLDPVLPGIEIDTINLTDDNKLYIIATDSSNTPAAYIYDIATDTMSNDISNGEKLHALKALIK